MTDLALLASQVGTSERTLRRAVNQGTVHASRATPRTLILPLDERHYIRQAWPLLAGIRSALRTAHNVRLAVLFGSAATGSTTASSDVDILVGLRDGDLQRVVDLGTKLALVAGRPVDIVRLRDAEADPAFLAEILGAGRVLVDRDRQWPELRAREPRLRRLGAHADTLRSRAALDGIDRLLAG